MENLKILVNPCHNSFKLFSNKRSNKVDGYYLSSCHISSKKMLDYINKRETENLNCDKLIFVDFFSSLGTIDIKTSDNSKCQKEILKRKINNIIPEKNIISLILFQKINEAENLIEKSILDWVDTINNANENFYYALPLPLMGNGKIFEKIWSIYLSIFQKNINLIKNKKLFVSLVVKQGSYFDANNMRILMKIANLFNIKICTFSVWRVGYNLLNDSDILDNISKFINYIDNFFKHIYLNYFHYELPVLIKIFPKANFICGTFEQTKILSPKIKWINEDNSGARFKIKFFLESSGITIKFDQYKILVNNKIIEPSKNISDSLKQTESFYLNYSQFKILLNGNKHDYLIPLEKLINLKNNKVYREMISRASIFPIEDFLKLYKYIDKK